MNIFIFLLSYEINFWKKRIYDMVSLRLSEFESYIVLEIIKYLEVYMRKWWIYLWDWVSDKEFYLDETEIFCFWKWVHLEYIGIFYKILGELRMMAKLILDWLVWIY